jgi:hypothetical protein
MKSSVKMLAGVALGLVLVVGSAGCAKKEQARTLDVRLVIADERGYTGSSPCVGSDILSDYKKGFKQRMQEGNEDDGRPIWTATFPDGELTSEGCEFNYQFKVVKGFKEYTVLNCEPGEKPSECDDYGFSWKDLEDEDFKFEWCVGCGGGTLGGGSGVDRGGDSFTG